MKQYRNVCVGSLEYDNDRPPSLASFMEWLFNHLELIPQELNGTARVKFHDYGYKNTHIEMLYTRMETDHEERMRESADHTRIVELLEKMSVEDVQTVLNFCKHHEKYEVQSS